MKTGSAGEEAASGAGLQQAAAPREAGDFWICARTCPMLLLHSIPRVSDTEPTSHAWVPCRPLPHKRCLGLRPDESVLQGGQSLPAGGSILSLTCLESIWRSYKTNQLFKSVLLLF